MVTIDFYLCLFSTENAMLNSSQANKEVIMFLKKECMALTGLTSGQIDSLRKHNIISGECYHGNKCRFSWSELVEMKTIAKLREKVSLQKIREAKEFLKQINFTDDSLMNKRLVFLSKNIVLFDEKEDILITLTGKYKGQYVLTVVFCNDILKELREDCQKKILNFEKRLKDNNLPNIKSIVKAS